MEDDLNVENLLEEHAERAPVSPGAGAISGTRVVKRKSPFTMTAWAIAAAVAVLATVMISGSGSKRGPVMERY